MKSRLDIIEGAPSPRSPSLRRRKGNTLRGRPWLAMKWTCCSVYTRIYRNQEGTAYEGRCPRCQRPVSVAIGPTGTHARFFEAY